MGPSRWVAIYRKHVRHRATKNYQLDLFDPNDGHYEYSAVTSNLDLTLANLWRLSSVRPRQSRENYRPAQERARLPHGTDHDVRGQQRMATPGGPHA